MPTEAPALPETFGRYRILKPLGRGGMGAVYLARDSQLDRDVALKVPQLGDGAAEVRERLVREARAAANVRHPNICPVYDIDEFEGILYLTMAYIPGRPLSDFLKSRKPIPSRQAALLVRKVALALQAAHGNGVIHRDLKPSNIMIDERSEPIVMDFGLARRETADGARLTQSGTIVGTPVYMSPEQIHGDPGRIGPGSDVYSLGVVLYELLTGGPPFDGPVTSVLSQVLTTEPEPPSRRYPGVDPGLEAICLRALAKRVEERFGSMRDFAAALTSWLRAEGTQSGRTSAANVVLPTETQSSRSSATATGLPSSGAAASVPPRSRASLWRLGGILVLAVGAAAAVVALRQPPVESSGPSEPRDARVGETQTDAGEPQTDGSASQEDGSRAPEATADDGWISLFDGTSLDGWHAMIKTKKSMRENPGAVGWEVRDGMLVRTGADIGLLYHERQFADLELEFEVQLPAGSGILVGLRKAFDDRRDLLLIPIVDGVGLRRFSPDMLKTAYIRRFQPVPALMHPAGEWNAVQIRCVGNDLAVTVNGREAVALRTTEFEGLRKVPRSGLVTLFANEFGTNIAIRNIRLRDLAGR